MKGKVEYLLYDSPPLLLIILPYYTFWIVLTSFPWTRKYADTCILIRYGHIGLLYLILYYTAMAIMWIITIGFIIVIFFC